MQISAGPVGKRQGAALWQPSYAPAYWGPLALPSGFAPFSAASASPSAAGFAVGLEPLALAGLSGSRNLREWNSCSSSISMR
jgi:hypothetical protein